MSILVTGGTGFIGSHIVKCLIDQGRDVVAYDSVPPPQESVLVDVMDRVKLEIGNVADLSQVLHVIKKHNVEGIIHTAAMAGTVANQDPAVESLTINIVGSANMLEAARILRLGRVIIYSSSAVMGAPEDVVTPRKEEEIVLPASGIFPLSMLACEHLVHTYRQLYRIDTIAIRPRCVYGPGESRYQHGQHPLPIYEVVLDAIAGNNIIHETGGDSSFDYTYVKDAALGTIQAYDCKSPTHYVYCLSYGRNTKMSVVCNVVKHLFPKLRVEVGPGIWGGSLAKHSGERPPQDISRARNDFSFTPKWDVEHAIPDWVNWLMKAPK